MSANFHIRRGTVADAEIVAEYNRRMAAETEDTHLDWSVLYPGVCAALEDDKKALYFVAEAEGKVIGQAMITFEWSDWRNGNVWWFQSVYVASEWRGQGVFRALYEHILQQGQEAGAVGFRLYAHHANANALATYHRLGMQSSEYIVMERFPASE